MPAELLIKTTEFGLVTNNMEAMRNFYCHFLGLQYLQQLDFEGGTMHRYQFGDSILKLVGYDETPQDSNPAGGGTGATGYRYCSLIISNLQELMEEAKTAGHNIAVDITPFGDGIGFAFLEDPDGNWVELCGPC